MKLAAYVVLVSGCVVNGKGYGPSAPSSASASSPSSGHQTAGYGPAAPAPADGVYARLPPYPTAPADPWAGVQGDEPVRWSAADADHWIVRANPHDCSAANDHCLLPHAWFVVRQDNLQRGGQVRITAHVFGPQGPAVPSNATVPHMGWENFIAFRTVPATRNNLRPGVLAIGLPRPHTHPGDGRDAVQAIWYIGEVEEVDLDIGIYKLKGYDDTMLLPGARVAVMSWKPGEKVQILGGRKRNELAVRRDEVFLPAK